jgi:hypothetical protein
MLLALILIEYFASNVQVRPLVGRLMNLLVDFESLQSTFQSGEDYLNLPSAVISEGTFGRGLPQSPQLPKPSRLPIAWASVSLSYH